MRLYQAKKSISVTGCHIQRAREKETVFPRRDNKIGNKRNKSISNKRSCKNKAIIKMEEKKKDMKQKEMLE